MCWTCAHIYGHMLPWLSGNKCKIAGFTLLMPPVTLLLQHWPEQHQWVQTQWAHWCTQYWLTSTWKKLRAETSQELLLATGSGMWMTPGSKSEQGKWKPLENVNVVDSIIKFTWEDVKGGGLPFLVCAVHTEEKRTLNAEVYKFALQV